MLVLKYEILFFFQTYRTGDMAWWEKIADFWWGEGWEEWLVFYTFFFIFWDSPTMCIQRSSCLSFIIRSSWRAFTYCQNQRRIPHLSSIKQSSQGGLLWRLAWYLRFFLPNYYAEHTHGKYSSEKSNQEAFMTGRYIFPTAEKAQL